MENLENLNKQKCNENLKQFVSSIFSIQLKIWKKASNSLIHNGKNTVERNKNFLDMFVILEANLSNIRDVFETTLKRISFMLKYIDETDKNRTKIINNTLKSLETDEEECQKKCIKALCQFANQNSFLGEDVKQLILSLSKL